MREKTVGRVPVAKLVANVPATAAMGDRTTEAAAACRVTDRFALLATTVSIALKQAGTSIEKLDELCAEFDELADEFQGSAGGGHLWERARAAEALASGAVERLRQMIKERRG